jgi:Secretion system C-terminal sorting domain
MRKIERSCFLFFATFIMLQSNIIRAVQNPAMIMAPRYYNLALPGWQTLPTGIDNATTKYYHGEVAAHAQNIMMNAAGTEILFFMVDGQIYNKYGVKYYNDDLSGNGGLFIFEDMVNKSELLIIPDPGNCRGYYIITNANDAAGSPYINYVNIPYEGLRNNNTTFLPGCQDATDSYFDNDSPYCMFNPDNPIFGGSPIQDAVPNANTYNFNGPKAELSLAATILNSNNERFVFLEIAGAGSAAELQVYKITTTSISYVGEIPLHGVYFSLYQNPELEVKETTDPNVYKIAYTSGYDKDIFYGTVNVSLLTSTGFTLALYQNGLYNIHGIEFSPNGNYLYTLKNGPSTFGYFDLTLLSPVFVNQTGNLPFAADYANSKLELDYNGKLFFTGTNKFMQVSNPNTPGSLSYSSTNFPIGFTHPTNILQDQIDGMNYSAHLLIPACCVQNTTYNKVDFTATANATWTPTFNPIQNGLATVTIGHSLVIPKDKVITISGMIIKFAPGAKLIIEDAGTGTNGGRLTLINSTLTVEQSCSTEEFWEGVEIWGNNLVAQGTFTTGKQGWMVMSTNSIIEKARIGVYCAKRDAGGYAIVNTGGGVIKGGSNIISTARITNCQTGVVLANYNYLNSNVVSSFERFTFETTAALIEQVNPASHLVLIGVRGVNIKGCTFKNSWQTTLISSYETTDNIRGTGITSINADYLVTKSGTTYITNFNNLFYGISAINTSGTNTYGCLFSTFTSCVRGIYNSNVDLCSIKDNTFKIYPVNTTNAAYTAYGLYLNFSTGYNVWNNTFYQNGSSVRNTKGLIVNNSGEASNLIYRNTFYNLKVGSQVIGINGVAYTGNELNIPNQGLVLKCNYYQSNLTEADMAYTSAPTTRVAYLQGDCSTLPTSTAGNRFSHSGNNALNDIYTDAGSLKFQYNTNLGPASVIPATGQYAPTKVAVAFCAGSNFDPATSCPAIPVQTPGMLMAKVNNAQEEVTQALEQAELSGALVEDEAEMNPVDVENLMELEIANSELAVSLNQLQSAYMLDYNYTDRLAEVIDVLDDKTDIESQRRLAMSYLEKENTLELSEVKTNLQEFGETKFVDYLSILEQVNENVKSGQLAILEEDSALMANIKSLVNQTEDVKAAGYADVLYSVIKGVLPSHPTIPELVFNNGLRTMQKADATTIDLAVYPNPVQDVLEIQIDNTGKLNCKIVDLSGKLIKEINLNETERNFSTSFLSAGIYFLEIKTEGNVKQLVRLVKE